MNDFFNILWTFGLTIAIEYPIVQFLWIVLIDDEKRDNVKFVFINNKLITLPCLIINMLTNPTINLFANYLWSKMNNEKCIFWIIISLLEVIVIFIECYLYKNFLKTTWKNALVLSLTANFTSYMFSFIL